LEKNVNVTIEGIIYEIMQLLSKADIESEALDVKIQQITDFAEDVVKWQKKAFENKSSIYHKRSYKEEFEKSVVYAENNLHTNFAELLINIGNEMTFVSLKKLKKKLPKNLPENEDKLE